MELIYWYLNNGVYTLVSLQQFKKAYLYPIVIKEYASIMAYINRTGVPNAIFDMYLKQLGYAELKVILIIIRQTYGWVDRKTSTHKQRDWISRAFFVKKTGLSKRAVSKAIAQLVDMNLIVVTSCDGTFLMTPEHRKRTNRLYFSCNVPSQTSYQNSIKAVPN